MRELVALCALLCAAPIAAKPVRVVALGGDITETVYALGAEAALAGVDLTSAHPAAARRLPNVGYMRSLNAEGILALAPTRVIAAHDAGPPEALAQLRAAGVAVDVLPEARDANAVVDKVRRIAALLGREAEGEALVARLRLEFDALARAAAALPARPRVLFMLTTGPGSPLVAGEKTRAAGIIALAGGQNAGVDFEGYKPVAGEALAALAPDVIVLMEDRLASAGGVDGVLAIPGVAQTPAGRARRVLGMEGGWLLGFGPRTPGAAEALRAVLANAVR
jgi:iron complex transport system substrate-binding protein